MRRIVMFNQVTADGYFAGPDGNLDWVVPDKEFDNSVAAGLPAAGTILFGRRTYELFETFWPQAVGDSATAPDPHGGDRSPEIRAIGVFINEATKLVFSRTLKNVTWRNSQVIHELDPREIEVMKRQPGADMMIFGSGSIVSQLTKYGLIDEYQFFVSPILLGNGRTLLSLRAKELDTGSPGGQTVPVGERHAALRALMIANKHIRQFPWAAERHAVTRGNLIWFDSETLRDNPAHKVSREEAILRAEHESRRHCWPRAERPRVPFGCRRLSALPA